ncbi:hypothetical protein MSAN_00371600 [Mycena sanguinolenta]|uniref:SHSP domain-containing protein n=1 Tax=Mycena sanguinolenta TaxID=230812 RepID=A0A8H6ZEL4_9AGAR|nr:hypothetical protein MSAN_00371600 [Mycena sanguinolenta]
MATSPPPRAVSRSPVPAPKPSISRRVTSPITPVTTAGVTGIVFPSPLESSASESNRPPRRMSNGISASASKHKLNNVTSDPPQVDETRWDDIVSVADLTAQGDVWNLVRAQKARKMDKEPAKVKSLEDYKPTPILIEIPSPRPASRLTSDAPKPVLKPPSSTAPSARTRDRRSLLEDVLSNHRSSGERDSFFSTPSPILPKAPSPAKPPSLKKKKSIVSYHTLPAKNYSIAVFDLRGVEQEDIRVTHHTDNTLVVSWEKWEVETWEEDDCIARRTVERVFHRVIPLAEGTKFRDIHCTRNEKEDLIIRYPLAVSGSRSVEEY